MAFKNVNPIKYLAEHLPQAQALAGAPVGQLRTSGGEHGDVVNDRQVEVDDLVGRQLREDLAPAKGPAAAANCLSGLLGRLMAPRRRRRSGL